MSWPLQGFEWVILLVIILLIFGPKKLPELARGIGQALYEFRKASQGILEGGQQRQEEKREEESKSKEIDVETLKKLAEKLGVDTSNKSKEELIKEIVAKAKEKGLLEEKVEEKAKATAPAKERSESPR